MKNWKEYIKKEKELFEILEGSKLIVEEEESLTYQQDAKLYQVKLEKELVKQIKEKEIEIEFAVIEIKSKEEFSILAVKKDIEYSFSKTRNIEKIIMVDKINEDMKPYEKESIKNSLTTEELKESKVILNQLLEYLQEKYNHLEIPNKEEWVNKELLV